MPSRRRRRTRWPSALTVTAFLLLATATAVTGTFAQESVAIPQASELARQSLRPYWHVFAAYALVIVFVAGWAVSIARRLRSVEERLVD